MGPLPSIAQNFGSKTNSFLGSVCSPKKIDFAVEMQNSDLERL
jgi:hypothetical protein